ncbi:MAG TPA: FHA domain-containing protein [Verrucomicrobiae bacterium]|nr:FHA domain-containing protein [Verrucomicrobiae bacterium]
MPKLIIKSGSQAGREVDLNAGVYRVGRNENNDISIPEASISSFHCELNVAEIGISVRDLGSTNGTFINEKQIAKGMLHSGDTLKLGEIQIGVEMPEVNIGIPDIPFEEAVSAAFLEDGTPACFNHREVAARYRCSRCENWWCAECVRNLKRLSGEFLQFCPECSAACTPIEEQKVGGKKSLFGRLGDTLRITRKK